MNLNLDRLAFYYCTQFFNVTIDDVFYYPFLYHTYVIEDCMKGCIL